jgi:hypothetical protein
LKFSLPLPEVPLVDSTALIALVPREAIPPKVFFSQKDLTVVSKDGPTSYQDSTIEMFGQGMGEQTKSPELVPEINPKSETINKGYMTLGDLTEDDSIEFRNN